MRRERRAHSGRHCRSTGSTGPPARRSRSPTRRATACPCRSPPRASRPRTPASAAACICATCHRRQHPGRQRRLASGHRRDRGVTTAQARSPRPARTSVVTSTIGGKAFRAELAPRAFGADVVVAGGATSVSVHGADPGGAVTIELTARGACWRARPRSRAPAAASTRRRPSRSPRRAVPSSRRRRAPDDAHALGSAVRSRRLRCLDSGLAGRLRRPAHLPAGSYAWELLFTTRPTRRAAGALGPCHALGPDVSGAAGCGGFGAGRAHVVDRRRRVARGRRRGLRDADRRLARISTLRSSPEARAARSTTAACTCAAPPRQPVTAAISSPRGALPPLKPPDRLTDAGGMADLGPERNAFPLHVADGATVSLSGAGVGSLPLGVRATGSPRRSREPCSRATPRPAPACSSSRARARERPPDSRPHRPRGLRRHAARSGSPATSRRLGGRPGDARRDDAEPDRGRLRAAHPDLVDQQPVAPARRRPWRACPRGRACAGAATSRRRSAERAWRFRSSACPTVPRASPRRPSRGPSATTTSTSSSTRPRRPAARGPTRRFPQDAAPSS